MNNREFINQIKNLVKYVEELERKLREAEYHIKRNITLFSSEELECMVIDGLIDYNTIPVDKRTEFVTKLINTETLQHQKTERLKDGKFEENPCEGCKDFGSWYCKTCCPCRADWEDEDDEGEFNEE